MTVMADQNASKSRIDGASHEQVITPWAVHGSVSVDGQQQAIDYDKLIDQFGTRRVDDALLARFESLTGKKPHVLLRRGMFFSHRYVKWLNRSELFLIIRMQRS